MSYPYPRRASRRQYFLAGLFAGGIAVASTAMVLSLASPRAYPPRFTELAIACTVKSPAWRPQEGLVPARMESIPTTLVCKGASK